MRPVYCSSARSSRSKKSDSMAFRICVPKELFENQTKMTSESKSIRESMIRCSMGWNSGTQKKRIFTPSGNSIGSVSLEYGKPGKFAGVDPKVSNFKPMDMRLRLSSNPDWVPDAWELYSPLSELWSLDESAAREINSLLMLIAWCRCFSQDEEGEFRLDLDERTISRIEEINREYGQCFTPYSLSEIILIIEGIAHIDDTNQYQPNRNGKIAGQSGRIMYIKTTIACAKIIADTLNGAGDPRKRLARFVNDIARSRGMITIGAKDLEDYIHICPD